MEKAIAVHEGNKDTMGYMPQGFCSIKLRGFFVLPSKVCDL